MHCYFLQNLLNVKNDDDKNPPEYNFLVNKQFVKEAVRKKSKAAAKSCAALLLMKYLIFLSRFDL